MRPRIAGWRTPLALLLSLTLTATLIGPAHADRLPGARNPATAAPGSTDRFAVTLVTGDRVMVDELVDGGYAVTAAAAERPGFDGAFQTIDDGAALYVVPSDAAPLLGDVLDRRLFDVHTLHDAGFTDGVPVITTHRSTAAAAPITAELSSIDAVTVRTDPAGQWWQQLRAAAGDAELGRVWLDAPQSVALAESVPLVGAPEAWQLGWDGSGVRVAVLDTGVDPDHPDLAGAVVDSADFTDSGTTTDEHGHGTHVAGTLAGRGDAAAGGSPGVAPGAEVLNGKVLGADGTGLSSGIIAGMEWAVAQGAEIVNLSLGGNGSDGTDPLSLAVNELTATDDVLFVVAAGNSGPGDHTVGAPGAADAALTVGSVDKELDLAAGSSRGPRAGDFAIKPDLTAPGVEIVAARAAGTDLGTPVDEYQTALSGTSMATPHVAGAAAILRHVEPELGAAELKARLIGSAAPDSAYDVYQQGAGRLDIPAALAAGVQSEPAHVDFGYRQYPHDDAEPQHIEVSYQNLTDDDLTFDLSLAVTSRDGAEPSEEMLAVTPATLTLPPGGAEAVTVTWQAGAGDDGLYGGYLLAAEVGTDQPAHRTPVGFYQEPERYDLTIEAVARDGRPAGGASSVAVVDAADMGRFMQPGVGLAGGGAELRVPPGTYSILGVVHTYDEHDEYSYQSSFVGDEVTVAGDVVVTLDAREANPVSVSVPEPDASPQGQVAFGFWRTAAEPGPVLGVSFFGMHPGREFFAQPVGPVELGEFEFYSRWRLAAPEAQLAVVEPTSVTLEPVLFRAPAVDGVHPVGLVDAGAGGADEMAAAGVAGAAALTRRGTVPIAEQAAHAAAAGAVALVVTNDVPGPLAGPMADPGELPVLSLTESEGAALRSLLAEGEVIVELSGASWSEYLYDLVLLESDEISSALDYHVAADQLARLDVGYHNDVDGHQMGEVRHFSRPFHSSSAYLHPYVAGPQQRSEYVLGGDALAYQQTYYGELPFESQLREPQYRSYAAGEEVTRSGFRQLLRPALVPEAGQTTRTADSLELQIYEWVDAGGNHFPDVFGLAPYPGDSVVTRLRHDGEVIGEAERPLGSWPVGADDDSFQLELAVSREAPWWERSVATNTVWEFAAPAPAAGSAPVPLLSVDYHLDLDLSNIVGDPSLELVVSQQAPQLPAIAAAQLWISYDDGVSWSPQSVQPSGDGAFHTNLPAPPPDHSGFGSIRVVASDVEGNQIDQEVIRAWRVPTQ